MMLASRDVPSVCRSSQATLFAGIIVEPAGVLFVAILLRAVLVKLG